MSEHQTGKTPTASSPETPPSSSTDADWLIKREPTFDPDWQAKRPEFVTEPFGTDPVELGKAMAEAQARVDNVIELAPRPQDNQAAIDELLARITHVPPADYFAENASEVYFELLDLLVSKQSDYGPRAINEAPGGALNGVLVRVHDKYERLRHLTQVGISPQHESIRDTWVDLANYAVIALLLIDGVWPRV